MFEVMECAVVRVVAILISLFDSNTIEINIIPATSECVEPMVKSNAVNLWIVCRLQ